MKKKQETKVPKTTENKYPMEDYSQMLLLFRAINFTYEQKDFLHQMLKKYVDPNHPKPIDGCSCPLSYGNALIKLRDWVSLNGNKFS